MHIRELNRTFSATISPNTPFGVSIIRGSNIEFDQVDLDVPGTIRLGGSTHNISIDRFLVMEEDELMELKENIQKLERERTRGTFGLSSAQQTPTFATR